MDASALHVLIANVLEHLPVGVAVLDRELRILQVNPALEALIEQPAAALLGQLLPAQWPRLEAQLAPPCTALLHGTPFRDLELHLPAAHGQRERWLTFSGTPVKCPAGTGTLGLVTVAEITRHKWAEAALRDSETRYRTLFDSIDEGFCIIELIFDAAGRPHDYRFLQANRIFAQLTGVGDPTGRTARELVPALEAFWFATFGQVALTGEAVRFEFQSQAMDRWFDVFAMRFGPATSRQVALLFTNITARKLAEEQTHAALAAEQAARRAAEALVERTAQLEAVTAGRIGGLTHEAVLQMIIDYGMVATGATIAVVRQLDPGGTQLEVIVWTGPTRGADAQVEPLPLDSTSPPARAVRTSQPLWLASRAEAEAGVPGYGAVMAQHGMQALAVLPLLVLGRSLGVISFGYPTPRAFLPAERAFLLALAQQCAQAIERTRLNQELQASQTRLQHLSQRLLATQEQERRHLARELHDEVGQTLTGLRLELELLGRTPPEAQAAHLATAQRATQELIGRIQTLSLDLRPAMLDDNGLLPAVLWLLTRYREQTGITVELRHRGLEQRLSPEIETGAYRVVQEALTNIARHAGVTEATVAILATPTQLLVQVRDAGHGFVLEEALANRRSSGLLGMQERVALLGGVLTIETAPGEGTTILAELPWHGATER